MRLALASVLAACCAACGWHAGVGVPEGARSVGVEAAKREGSVLERGLEPLLTDALSEAVEDWVDLPLVAPDQADLVVRAEVLEYRRRGGVRATGNRLLESAVFVRARAELFDRRRGAHTSGGALGFSSASEARSAALCSRMSTPRPCRSCRGQTIRGP